MINLPYVFLKMVLAAHLVSESSTSYRMQTEIEEPPFNLPMPLEAPVDATTALSICLLHRLKTAAPIDPRLSASAPPRHSLVRHNAPRARSRAKSE